MKKLLIGVLLLVVLGAGAVFTGLANPLVETQRVYDEFGRQAFGQRKIGLQQGGHVEVVLLFSPLQQHLQLGGEQIEG